MFVIGYDFIIGKVSKKKIYYRIDVWTNRFLEVIEMRFHFLDTFAMNVLKKTCK